MVCKLYFSRTNCVNENEENTTKGYCREVNGQNRVCVLQLQATVFTPP